MNYGGGVANQAVVPWNPRGELRVLNSAEVALSRGFLRARPEKWFPGFAEQWLPLAHSLGVEMRISDVRPVAAPPRELDYGFVGSVDGELISILIDESAAEALLDCVAPSSVRQAQPIILEYLARRLLGSLALSWSGPESSVVLFDPSSRARDVQMSAGVKVGFEVNGVAGVVWIGLGERFASRLDGLWRRQIRSSAKGGESGTTTLHLEIAQLAVPPASLVDYVRPGTTIDLEVPMTDLVTLRLQGDAGGKAWLAARLAIVENCFAVEILPGPLSVPPVSPGTNRMGIELGIFTIDGANLAEMSQAGSVWETGIAVSHRVSMVVNNDRIAQAALSVFDGRFAVLVD